MLNERKTSVVLHGIFFCLFVILMGIGSFYDLQINHTLSDGNSFFGALFALIGEYPAYLALPIATTVLFYNDYKVKKNAAILLKIIFAALIFISIFAWGVMSTKLGEPMYVVEFSLIYAAIGLVVCLGLGKFVKKDTVKVLFKWAIFAIIVVLTTTVVIRLLKLGWGRMRYRDMLAAGDFSGFTPWYLPQGKRTGDFTSFPSGHAASAMNIFVYLPLGLILPGLKKYRPYIFAVCVLFVAATALARIIYNAHFLTDVLMGGFISYLIYFLSKKVVFKDNKEFKKCQREN